MTPTKPPEQLAMEKFAATSSAKDFGELVKSLEEGDGFEYFIEKVTLLRADGLEIKMHGSAVCKMIRKKGKAKQ